MSRAGQSLFYFGIYGILTGSAFLVAPALVLEMVHLPAMPDGWARTIGLLAYVISSYNVFCGRSDVTPFIQASVVVRTGFFVGSIMLVVFGQMPIMMVGMGLVDAFGALWTHLALKADARAPRRDASAFDSDV